MGGEAPETCWATYKLVKLLHLVGWFIWIVWWCTDLGTSKKKTRSLLSLLSLLSKIWAETLKFYHSILYFGGNFFWNGVILLNDTFLIALVSLWHTKFETSFRFIRLLLLSVDFWVLPLPITFVQAVIFHLSRQWANESLWHLPTSFRHHYHSRTCLMIVPSLCTLSAGCCNCFSSEEIKH